MLTHRRQRDVPAGMSAVTPADTSADMPADIARAIGALDAAIAGFRERAEADTAMIAGLQGLPRSPVPAISGDRPLLARDRR
jgi:hypothetical protein